MNHRFLHFSTGKRLIIALIMLVSALGIALMLGHAALTVHAQSLPNTITVNSASDDQTPATGTCVQSGTICLRNAIAAAALNNSGTLINFTSDSVITLIPAHGTLELSNTLNNPIEVDGTGHQITINGNDSVSIFTVDANAALELNNLTLVHGQGSDGGAINDSGLVGVLNSTLYSNTVSGSAGSSGGAVYIASGGQGIISNSTLYGNNAPYGGGVSSHGSVTISNSTLTKNSAQYGGGLDIESSTNYLYSSIVSGNVAPTATDIRDSASTPLVSRGYNLIGDASTVNGVLKSSDQSGVTAVLGFLASNGGVTQTVALGVNSAAIGKGDCAGDSGITPPAPVSLTDQRGDARKNTGSGLGCDVGAFETPLPPTATPTNTATATATGTFTATATPTATLAATSTPTPGSGTPPAGMQIIIQGFAFSPNNLTIPVGTTVVWINQQAGVSHTTTSDTGVWSSAHLSTGQWFAYTFNTIGDFTYHCAIHTSMTGVIHVVNPTSTATNTAISTSTPTATATGTALPPRIDSIGIYRAGTFYLRLHNTFGYADSSVAFNPPGHNLPVVGDWTGASFDAIGVFDQNTANFTLCNANSTSACAILSNRITFTLGNMNDTPLSGRWQLSATHAGAGVYRPSNGILYLKNSLTTGFADYGMVMGLPGDEGVAGDWTGKGFDSPGIYRPGGIAFYLSNRVTSGVIFADISLIYGSATDLPITGDWIAQGHDGVGMFRPTNGYVYLKNILTSGYADNSFFYGTAGDQPVAGHWQVIYPPEPPAPVLIAKTAVPVPGSGSVPGDNQLQ